MKYVTLNFIRMLHLNISPTAIAFLSWRKELNGKNERVQKSQSLLRHRKKLYSLSGHGKAGLILHLGKSRARFCKQKLTVRNPTTQRNTFRLVLTVEIKHQCNNFLSEKEELRKKRLEFSLWDTTYKVSQLIVRRVALLLANQSQEVCISGILMSKTPETGQPEY